MIAFDSNILVYAQEQSDDTRHMRSKDLVYRASESSAMIPLQVLGEFLNICIRKLGLAPVDAIDQLGEYIGIFNCPATAPDDLIGAVGIQSTHRLQFFDALVVAVASRAGAMLLLSEDMHDGLAVGGLRIVNPFNPANGEIIAAYLA